MNTMKKNIAFAKYKDRKMSRQEKINRLPAEQKQNLRNHYGKIAKCNTAELLEYSKILYKQKNKMPLIIKSLLFEAIDSRREQLNGNLDQILECNNKKAVSEFMKGRGKCTIK